jgi:O-antigen/teichoic acid export membrane protein
MSIEGAFTMRVIVISVAGGLVVFVALVLIRSIISGGKRAVWEILRVTAGLVCMLLAALSGRGNIGSWGAWLGFGGVLALLLATLIFRRSDNQRGPRSHRTS